VLIASLGSTDAETSENACRTAVQCGIKGFETFGGGMPV